MVCTMFVFLAEEDPKYTCKCNLVFFLKERVKGHKESVSKPQHINGNEKFLDRTMDILREARESEYIDPGGVRGTLAETTAHGIKKGKRIRRHLGVIMILPLEDGPQLPEQTFYRTLVKTHSPPHGLKPRVTLKKNCLVMVGGSPLS